MIRRLSRWGRKRPQTPCAGARLTTLALCALALGAGACKRRPPPGAPIAVVQDFESGVTIRRWPKEGEGVAELSTEWSADGKRSLKLGPGMMGAFGDLAASDWRGYAVLRFHVHNPAADTLVVGVEIQDDHDAFADRHQQSFGAPPGDHTIELDFSGGLWRGEENRPYRGATKGPIDVARISRLAFVNRGTSGPIYIDRIEIERVPPIATPGGFAFDFGPAGAQVMGQTIGVDETTSYTPERGHGFVGAPPLATIRPMSYPTPLLGDGLGFEGGGFSVDLPGGAYVGWIAFERGGFWETEGAVYSRATLRVNGDAAHEHTWPRSAAHFFFEDTELTDVGQIVDRMVWPAHQVSRFRFQAKKGTNHFTLDVADPNHLPLRVAGLILAPDTPEGHAFLDAHERRQREAVARSYAPRDRGRRAGRSAPSRPIVIEQLPVGAQVYPRDWPERPDSAEEIVGIAGQVAVLHLGVHVRRTTRVHVHAEPLVAVGGTRLPAPRVLHGRYLPMRPLGGGAAWLEVNHYRPDPDFDAGPDLARSVVLELPIPEDAKPGFYAGGVRVTTGDESAVTAFAVRVYPVRLPALPVPVGLLMNALPFGPEVVGEERWWALQEALLEEQGRAGLTCVTGGAGLDYTVEKREGAYVLGGERALRYLGLAKKHGLGAAVVPYGGFFPSLTRRRYDAKAFAPAWKAFAEAKGLPPHFFYAYDEPGTEPEIEKATAAAGPFSAAGLATLGFTSMRKGDARFERMLDATTAPALNGHEAGDLARLKARGKHPWVYNQGLDRYAMGLLFWRNLRLGAEGRLEWIGLITQGLAFDNLDGREPATAAWMVHDRLGVLPTPKWLAAREGLMDLRVRLALSAAVPAGDATLAGWVEGYPADREAWGDRALSAARRAMLERIAGAGR